MARIETDPNYTTPTFSRATASTDLFKKEDVQQVAAALSTHDHTSGKGLPMTAGSIPNGTITSAMIADATIDTADLKDGAVTSAKILDGTIATGDLANSAVTNAKLGTDTARLNLLTNGGFEIWQRGNGPFTTAVPGPDRWGVGPAGTDTLSVSKDTTNIDSSLGSRAAAACTFTLGTGAGASALSQNLAAADGQQIANRVMTLSVRVRTSTANAVRVAIYNGSSYTYSSFHTGDGTWQTLTASATIASAYTVAQTLVYFAASCTAYVDNAMLVVGSVAADYAPLHPADDLARCLRYYEIVGETAGEISIYGYQAAGGATGTTTPLKVRKAVVPTVTKNGTWGIVNNGQPIIAGSGVGFISWYTVAIAVGQVNSSNTGAGSNFTAEANP